MLIKNAAMTNGVWPPITIQPDAVRPVIKEKRVTLFGVSQAQSTTTIFINIAIGDVTKEDHHSSFLFFVFHNR